ncbi:TPA: DapH/DapD/GlmU-related protein [Vibrio vulnificus]|nr:acyltransferase [Vibrio vulnificus]HDY8041819.1 acyltransferase [Vibrio vulnificus]
MLSVYRKIRFWLTDQRVGPDMPMTHWMLFSQRLGYFLCKRKFKYFGHGASIRPGAYAVATDKISLGNNVVIRPGCMLHADPEPNGAEIIIEDDVLIGSSVHIYLDTHAFSDISQPIYYQGFYEAKSVTLKKGCWIGAGVIILPGVTIGKNSVVGAGSVVTKCVPDYSVAVGNPAKVIKTLSSI